MLGLWVKGWHDEYPICAFTIEIDVKLQLFLVRLYTHVKSSLILVVLVDLIVTSGCFVDWDGDSDKPQEHLQPKIFPCASSPRSRQWLKNLIRHTSLPASWAQKNSMYPFQPHPLPLLDARAGNR